MDVKKIVAFLFLFLVSCAHESNVYNHVHIVPPIQKPIFSNNPNEPPPPPARGYYFAWNFIIDTAERVYFYQLQRAGSICGTGINNGMQPEVINLKPKDLIQIPASALKSFIEVNLLYVGQHNKSVAIASVADTIKSESASLLFNIFSTQPHNKKWIFRKVTPEERIVLHFKKSNSPYYPDQLTLDSSMNLVPPEIDGPKLFTHP